jgi:transposase
MRGNRNTRGTATGPLSTINPHAAGIDVGATFHVVAVPYDRDEQPVRTFRTFSSDLHQLADWLTAIGITTIAMESTGVSWIPVFELLEARGVEVLLVNARDVKHVSGRKSDVSDAQWLQQLHQYGLLRGSFRPRDAVVQLRAYLRHRERLVEYAASHIQHMQKALMQMNVQLHHVVTDITGVTGMRIIRAIVAGTRAPDVLAAFRDVRCAASEETIREALTGHYRPEHVFALRHALELYDVHQAKLAECDTEIEAVLRALNEERPTPAEPLPAVRHTKSRNEPKFDARRGLYTLLGADLTQIHGFGPYTVLRLIGECGDDMRKWPTAKHFTSWLSLAGQVPQPLGQADARTSRSPESVRGYLGNRATRRKRQISDGEMARVAEVNGPTSRPCWVVVRLATVTLRSVTDRWWHFPSNRVSGDREVLTPGPLDGKAPRINGHGEVGPLKGEGGPCETSSPR